MEKSIDALKEIVVSLRNVADDNGFDYETKVSDWMFSVESEYQAYYGLEEDDWDVDFCSDVFKNTKKVI